MKIVIDIDNEIYGRIQALVNADYHEHDIYGYSMQRIANGTPLPNGHGRLTDLDEVIRFTYATYGIGSGRSITEDNKDLIDYIYNDAPVLVEADKESEND